MNRDKIVKFCEDYLSVKDFEDHCHNGLQVEGAKEVKKIITGVSFSQKLIEKAIENNAEMIMVHHGIFTGQIGKLPVIKSVLKNRLKSLLKNNINLCGFHLPLDAHPVIGNNISICNMLGIKKVKKFEVGFVGELKTAENFESFVKKVNKKLNTRSYAIGAGPKKVKKVGVISGGASPHVLEAAELGVDTYICGDIREEVVRRVEELGINFINAGHYNSEVFGIKNLGELLAKKFKIKVKFIDIPNEI